MALGLNPLEWLGIGANAIQGHSANKAQKEKTRRESQLLDMANQNYRQTQPYFQQGLQQAAMFAGLGDGVTRGASGNFQLGAMPGQRPGGMGSGWGTPEDQLRFQAAEEDINKAAMQRANQLRFQMQRMGLNEGAIGANLGRNASAAQQQLGQFRRGLAIDAPAEQARRLQALQQFIGMGFGQGSQAMSGYGQQAGQFGQQANQAYGNLGGILQNNQYQQMLGGLQPSGPKPRWWEGDQRSSNYGGGLGGLD
jgi:hypothetical protein